MVPSAIILVDDRIRTDPLVSSSPHPPCRTARSLHPGRQAQA